MPAASATSAISASSSSVEVGRDLEEDRDRAGEAGARLHHPAEQRRKRRAALQVAQPLGVGRGDVDRGEIDIGAADAPAPRRNRRRGRRCPCSRRGSGRPARPARRRGKAGPAIAAAPSLLKPKRLITARSSVRRNRRGRGLPGCGRGVAAPTSTKPKPARDSGPAAPPRSCHSRRPAPPDWPASGPPDRVRRRGEVTAAGSGTRPAAQRPQRQPDARFRGRAGAERKARALDQASPGTPSGKMWPVAPSGSDLSQTTSPSRSAR